MQIDIADSEIEKPYVYVFCEYQFLLKSLEQGGKQEIKLS